MASSQPIAFPSPQDVSGSYTASYSRHFLGSPVSWRAAGSFGSRFYPGSSPGTLLGPLDPNDFKTGKLSSSIESDRGSLLNALNVIEREDEMCRNFSCCGLQLNDLHALLEHFEEVHVVVLDPHMAGHNPSAYLNLATPTHYPQLPVQQHHQQLHHQPPTYLPQQPTYGHSGPFDPDDMELDVDASSTPSSGAPTPPDTPITTPLSSYPTHTSFPPNSYSHSQPPSPPHHPISAFDTTPVLPSRSSLATSFFAPRGGADAFNAYAGYSDYSASMPGTVPSPSDSTSPAQSQAQSEPGSPYAGGVPTALLFSSAGPTPANTPSTSRVPSPSAVSSASTPTGSGPTSPRASTTLSRPASSLLLSKPFRCPKPNCNKSYKQANGLKYHMTHGSCNFAPPKDLEQVQALLASKRSGGGEDVGLSECELREVEREAERRLRPFACGVGECQRRYKNMNGLRYHYSHSGDHGAVGLRLLASGQHECLQHAHGRSGGGNASGAPSAASSRQGTPGVSTPASRSGASTPAAYQYPQEQVQMAYQQQPYFAQQQQSQNPNQFGYGMSG